ncbi:MAG: hypothetical protein IJ920_07225, partial [Paludibacteraceae bacterium]|nr:hypothetical protein [Paludibacteraceae bacterium]
MRKFFLIPLLTLVCSVMAWAGKIDYKALPMPNPDGAVIETPAPAKAHKAVKESEDPVNEAKIGETEYATLFEAFIAAENNDVIELLADVNPSTWYAGELDNTSVTIKGNGHIIRKTPIFVNETDDPMVITFDGVTVNAASWFAYAIGDVTIVLADGTTNTLTSAKKYGFCGQGAGDLKITGNGELSATADYMFYQMHSVVLEAGTYNINPLEYVDLEHFLVTKVSSNYKVSTPAADVVAYNLAHLTTYTSLADAVEAAQVREIITLYADATSISVDKHIGFNANGFNASAISAAAGYQKVIEDDLIVFNSTAADSFAEFLASEGTAAYELSDDIDISLAGTLTVNGTKTLTIPESKKILYARQMTGSNIIVNENAKLTILGSGTFQPAGGTSIETSTNEAEQVGRHIIDVYGELVVGVKNDPNNQPHFITTSLVRGSEAVYVRKGAQATFNNAHMQLGCVSIQNYGTTVIEGGEYISVSSASNGINNASWWSYNLQNYGKMTINGGHVQGVHGALACQNAYSRDQIENNGFEDVSYAVINGGLFETVHGTNFATGKANAKDNYRALYISNYAVVDIHGGEFKVQLPSACGEMAQIGNNDAYNTYGIVNLYGGKFQQKIKVAAKKNGESSYPASIPVNSAWYSSFKDEVPIPAGYELYDITEGEDYEAGYRYGVRPVAGKAADGIDADAQAAQEADPTYTIPWQVSTTWASDVVPEATTIVTIPVGATVTVQNG